MRLPASSGVVHEAEARRSRHRGETGQSNQGPEQPDPVSLHLALPPTLHPFPEMSECPVGLCVLFVCPDDKGGWVQILALLGAAWNNAMGVYRKKEHSLAPLQPHLPRPALPL